MSDTSASMTKSHAIYALVVLVLINSVNYMDRAVVSVLAPLIGKDLSLTDTQLGIIGGLAFTLFYAIMALPIGAAVDRFTQKIRALGRHPGLERRGLPHGAGRQFREPLCRAGADRRRRVVGPPLGRLAAGRLLLPKGQDDRDRRVPDGRAVRGRNRVSSSGEYWPRNTAGRRPFSSTPSPASSLSPLSC